MRPWTLGAIALGGLAGIIGWQAVSQEQAPTEAVQSEEQAPSPETALAPAGDTSSAADGPVPEAAAPTTAKVSGKPLVTEGTPLGKRIAVIGLLNKRNGVSREFTLRPGQAIRVGDVVLRLRACETTAPWEDQQLTGAFIQTDVRGRDGTWRRVFSGWLFKESPSLNAVEDPVYDVWPKSCTMVHPDIGPDTVRLSGSAASGGGTTSSAKKSARGQAASETEPAPAKPSAESSNAT